MFFDKVEDGEINDGKKSEKIIKERIEPLEAELYTIKDLIIEANRLIEDI